MTDDATAQTEKYHLLLGKFVAGAIEVESRIDSVVSAFFEMSGPMYSNFQNWVLNELTLNKKIELLEKIADFVEDDKAATKQLLAGLKAMQATRNDLAHGRYRQVVEISEAGRTELGLHRVPKKAGHLDPARKPLDFEELGSQLEGLEKLRLSLGEIMSKAFDLWPTTSTTSGPDGQSIVTRNPGTLEERERILAEKRKGRS